MRTDDAGAHNGLDGLTRARAVESLKDLLGEEEARRVWESMCRNLNVHPDGPLNLDEIEAIAEALMELGGPVSLVGNSLSIRVRTYRMLEGASRLQSFLGPPGGDPDKPPDENGAGA